MEEVLYKLGFGAVVVVILFSCLRGCSSQSVAKNWGGDMEVTLEPNQKLMEVTWKDNSLWFLTKQMGDDDVAESYSFYEKDPLGMLEGCVNIKEQKLSQDELDNYNNQRIWESHYYNYGNMDENGNPVFIEYNMETDEYRLLRPYKIEEGTLVPQ